MENSVISNFGVEIIDYSCIGDENSYANHLFTIRIWVDQNMFSVNRTYAAFCEFDTQLRRKYPRSNVPTLPLSGAAAFARRATVKLPPGGAVPDAKAAALDLRASMIGLADDTPTKGKMKPSVRRADKAEVISQKKSPLNGYLNTLLTLPEVLLSDNLLYFLDEESSDGQVLSTQTKELSEVDILLSDEVPVAKTVLRQLKIPMNLDPGSVIVWSFSTKHYDIGFSIAFNDKVILPYQRYNSFTEAVSGSIQITDQGKLMLIWDNKYSKMRSKQLLFTIKVFSKEEYEAAKGVASEASKEKAQRSQQRALLKRALAQASKGIYSISNQGGRIAPLLLTSGSGGNTTSEAVSAGLVASETEDGRVSELSRLRDEKRSLQRALSEAEAALVEERHASAGYLDRIEDLVSQRDLAEKELAFLRGNNEDGGYGFTQYRKESNATEKMKSFGSESETLSLHAPTADTADDSASSVGDRADIYASPASSLPATPSFSKSTEQIILQEADSEAEARNTLLILQMQEQIANLSETVESLKNKLSSAKEDQHAAESQVGKLKAERKALKEYAIKLKSEGEQQQATIKELSAEIEELKNSVESIVAINVAIQRSQEIMSGVSMDRTELNVKTEGDPDVATVSFPLVSPDPLKPNYVRDASAVSTSMDSRQDTAVGVPVTLDKGSDAFGRDHSPAAVSSVPVVAISSGVVHLQDTIQSQISTNTPTLATPSIQANTPASLTNTTTSTPERSLSATDGATASSSTAVNSPVKKSKLVSSRKSRANVAPPTLFVDDFGF
jgi:ribosomal protein S15P/S13E